MLAAIKTTKRQEGSRCGIPKKVCFCSSEEGVLVKGTSVSKHSNGTEIDKRLSELPLAAAMLEVELERFF